MPERKSPTLSGAEREVLRLLTTGGQAYGLELVRRSDGALKRGTVYVTLQRMEEKGFVRSYQEESTEPAIGIRRRRYEPTALGSKALAAKEAADRVWAMPDEDFACS